jgi:hypothetical protein
MYTFWQTGPRTYRGYPKSKNADSQLLIILELQVSLLVASTGEIITIAVDKNDTGAIVKEKAAAASQMSSDDFKWTVSGIALESDKTVTELAAGKWTARVKRLPYGEENKYVEPMLLMNTLNADPNSSFGKLVKMLTKIEYPNEILIWTKSDAQADGEECEVTLVELPRLGLSFSAKPKGGGVRLSSLEYDGLFLSTQGADDVLSRFAGNLPHCLMMKNEHQESFLLVPNYGLRRKAVTGMFPTEVYLSRSAEWNNVVKTRYFLYPVHSSGATLITNSTTDLLYLIVMHLVTLEYQKCGQLMPNLKLDRKLTPEEVVFLTEISNTIDDEHPDAVGLRLQIALMCKSSGNSVPFDYSNDYARYRGNYKHVSAPFRISAADEIQLNPPPERELWLKVVVANEEAVKLTRHRGPLTRHEMKTFFNRFLQERKTDFDQYPELREVMEAHFLEQLTPEEYRALSAGALKDAISSCFHVKYSNLEKQVEEKKVSKLHVDVDDISEEYVVMKDDKKTPMKDKDGKIVTKRRVTKRVLQIFHNVIEAWMDTIQYYQKNSCQIAVCEKLAHIRIRIAQKIRW